MSARTMFPISSRANMVFIEAVLHENRSNRSNDLRFARRPRETLARRKLEISYRLDQRIRACTRPIFNQSRLGLEYSPVGRIVELNEGEHVGSGRQLLEASRYPRQSANRSPSGLRMILADRQ
jgi:hypothetical protein